MLLYSRLKEKNLKTSNVLNMGDEKQFQWGKTLRGKIFFNYNLQKLFILKQSNLGKKLKKRLLCTDYLNLDHNFQFKIYMHKQKFGSSNYFKCTKIFWFSYDFCTNVLQFQFWVP
jgi:hypothetical protein